MKNTVKRITALLMSMLLIISVPMGVAAADLSAVPVIYIGEMSDNPLYRNPETLTSETVFDINSSDFLGDMTSVATSVLLADTAGGASAGAVSTINAITELMKPILCDEDGNSLDENVGVWHYNNSVGSYGDELTASREKIGYFLAASNIPITANDMYYFSYDWRLDPLETAESFKDFVDHVENMTGKNKVAVLAFGYGGIIVNSYFYKYEKHAADNIYSTVFYNCPLLGNAIIGDFMKGRVTRKRSDEDDFFATIGNITGEKRGNALFSFVQDDSMGLVSDVITHLLGDSRISKLFGGILIQFIPEILKSFDLHKDMGKMYDNFAANADTVIYNTVLKEYLRNMPGLWALVPEKDFGEAMNFLYKSEYIGSELADKIYAYRNVLENTADTLITAQENGINVTVVAGHGLQLLPVTISIYDLSDSFESVQYASAGAVTTSNSKNNQQFKYCTLELHDHTYSNSDGEVTIDASYCFLPENTWFIEGIQHGNISEPTVAEFIVWLLFSDTQRNIRENKAYPQYLKKNNYSKLGVDPLGNANKQKSDYMYGDVTLDGKITAADARKVLRISVELDKADSITRVIADVNGNKKVDSGDAREILRYSVGLIFKFSIEDIQ